MSVKPVILTTPESFGDQHDFGLCFQAITVIFLGPYSKLKSYIEDCMFIWLNTFIVILDNTKIVK